MANIQSITITANTTGDLINRTFPQALVSTTYTTSIPIALLGLQLASSTLNDVAGSVVGIHAGKAVQNTDTISLQNSPDVWLTHVYNRAAASLSQMSATGFGDINLTRLESGMGISLYLTAPNNINILVTGALTLWFYPINVNQYSLQEQIIRARSESLT